MIKKKKNILDLQRLQIQKFILKTMSSFFMRFEFHANNNNKKKEEKHEKTVNLFVTIKCFIKNMKKIYSLKS